jgi:endonuclease/exonuclease/phosphatase (EEP) superfamily protein YafD
VADWPTPPAPPGEPPQFRGRDLRQGMDDDESARILQWPGPRAPASAVPEPVDEPRTSSWAHAGRVLVPAAVVLALWAATCLLDGVRPELLDRLVVAAASVSTFAVVAAIPLAALAIRARRWVAAGVAVVAALVPWVFVLGYALPGGPAPANGFRLSVMVLNADADADAGGADAPSVVAAVARQPVDVLVVTEVTGELTHRLTTSGLDPGLQARWASLPGAGGGICVYSRYRVTAVEPVVGTRWPAARITVDTGRGSVTVIAGRAWPASRGTDVWRSDLAALAATRGPGPTVLAGTLDATPQQPAFRRLTRSGLQDAAWVLGRGVRPTWPSWSPLPLVPLDHVLVGGGIGVRWIGTVPVAGTSHRALVADLVVPSTKAPSPLTGG